MGEGLLEAEIKQFCQISLLACVGEGLLHVNVWHIRLNRLKLAAGASGGFWGALGGVLGLSGLPFEGVYRPFELKTSVC